MKKNCIILTTNEIDITIMLPNYKDFDYIVTEKGAIYSSNNLLNIVKILGDFDSLNQYDRNQVLLRYPDIELYPSDKDETDGEIAIQYAIKQGYDRIYMMVSGYRVDHDINHCLILNKYSKSNIYIYNGTSWMYLLKKGENIISPDAQYVSLFAFSKDILTSENLHFPLSLTEINSTDTKFISNRIKNKSKPTKIISKSGKTICIITVVTKDLD